MTTKIAISLPDEQVEAAKRAVAEGRAPSVSAYVSGALARQHERQRLTDLVARWNAEDGDPTAEDHAWAASALYG